MKHRLLVATICSLSLACSTASAQNPTHPSSFPSTPAPTSWLQALDASAGTVQTLLPSVRGIGTGARLEFQMKLRGQVLLAELEPRGVRSSGYELLIDDGTTIQVSESLSDHAWLGTIRGLPGSRIAATYTSGVLRALITEEGRSGFTAIQPAGEVVPAASPRTYLVHHSSDAIRNGRGCGVINTPSPPTNATLPGEDGLQIAQLALEADYPLFLQLGASVPAVESYLLNLVNQINLIYERDVDLRHDVSTILVRTAPDPYTATDAGALLGQFSNWWNTNRAGTPRALAHLCTGRNLTGFAIGVANTFSACNTFAAYGLSQLSFSPNLTRRIALVAHELGHCWGARHCDGDPDCSLMCAVLGICPGTGGTFGNRSKSAIQSFMRSVACLRTPPPVLTSTLPVDVPSLLTGPVQLIGDNLSTVTSVRVNGQLLSPNDYQIIGDNRIDFTPADPMALAPEQIQVTSPTGPSNTLTYNRVANTPPLLDAPGNWIGGIPLSIRAAAEPGRAVFLFGNLNDPVTLPLLGFDLISSPVLIRSGFADTVGRFDQILNPPFGIRAIDLRLQLISLNSSVTLIEGVSVPLLVRFP